MIYRTLRRVFMGIAMLAPLSLAAQEFDSELQLSDEETVCWYRICNAAPGMDSYAMTDLNPTEDSGEEHDDALRMGVYLLPTETEDTHSQWKLTAGEDGKVIIINRATGSQIGNHSAISGDHNFTWLTFSHDAPGFTVTSLGDYAFKLEGVEDDGVNRCLALAERGGEALAYPETGESTSIIGWKFFPVEIETGIGSAKASRPVVISVKNKRISVSGSTDWQLFNISGEEMPRTVSLPTGVYLVKMPQKSVKVLIP